MEVILLERIEKLGQMGDVVKVKNGFARNFLLPQKKALRATEENKRQFEEKRVQLEASNLERRQEAEAVGKKLDGLTVVMVRQAGEAGQLYGSVNARDIATGLTDAGFTVTRQQVVLPEPIKAIGIHSVRVSLHPEVIVEINTNVARSDDEAKVQAKTGKAVVSAEEEQETPAAEAAPADEPAAEVTEEAEEKADEAVLEQAEEIFEEGAAPNIEPEAGSESGPDGSGASSGDADKDGGAPEK